MDNGKPIRFVEIINYSGTTLDPLEIFISNGMAVELPNNVTISASHSALLPDVPALPLLTEKSQHAHVFPNLSNRALILVG